MGLNNCILSRLIYTPPLARPRPGEEATSGLLCTAIVGGAFLPVLVGVVSDSAGYVLALIVPAICYVLLCLFAVAAGRAKVVEPAGLATVH
jgi:FHS family L-fucose permease-like MFS transporter